MNHVASFSTGLSSALMVERLLARYGPEIVTIVAMDTLIEDEDNYRFAAAMEQRWGKPITWLREGRTPYEVAEDQNIIPNAKIAPCTFKLKIEPFVNFIATLPKPVTVHIGFDFAEVHRCEATTKSYTALGYEVDYPLLWKPVEERSYSQVARDDWGIEPPRMYAMGYSHANCGGRCVKQGKSDWFRTLVNFPERYAESEAFEERMRAKSTHADWAMMRENRNKKTRAYPLKGMREMHERATLRSLGQLDRESGCVVCGVGDLTP